MSVSNDLDNLFISSPELFGLPSGGSNMVPLPNLTGGSAGGGAATSGGGKTIFGDVERGAGIFTMLFSIAALALVLSRFSK